MARDFAFAFLDCEFGGLDPELHDITEIGVILTDDQLVESAEAQWRVKARPERITDEAAKMFGYDPALWAVAPGVRQVLTEVADMLPKDRVVVPAGQNVRMDVLFLERAYKSCDIPYPFDYHVIDLATLFQAWSLVAGRKLGGLSLRQAATTAGLLDASGVAHRALEDARLTLECYRHFIGRLSANEPDATHTDGAANRSGATNTDGAANRPGATKTDGSANEPGATKTAAASNEEGPPEGSTPAA